MCGFVGLYLNNNYNIEVRKLVSILNNMTNTFLHIEVLTIKIFI